MVHATVTYPVSLKEGRRLCAAPGHCYPVSAIRAACTHDTWTPWHYRKSTNATSRGHRVGYEGHANLERCQFSISNTPDKSQIDAAVKQLAGTGCVDLSHVEREGGDEHATRLGIAVAKLPLGVRFG